MMNKSIVFDENDDSETIDDYGLVEPVLRNTMATGSAMANTTLEGADSRLISFRFSNERILTSETTAVGAHTPLILPLLSNNEVKGMETGCLDTDVDTVDNSHEYSDNLFDDCVISEAATSSVEPTELRSDDLESGSQNKKDLPSLALKPKRPLSSYNFFFHHERQSMLEQMPIRAAGKPRRSHGKIGFADLARSIAAKWKSLSEEERKPFDSKAMADKERYVKEMDKWKKTQMLEASKAAACMATGFNEMSSIRVGMFGSGGLDSIGSMNVSSFAFRPKNRLSSVPSRSIESNNYMKFSKKYVGNKDTEGLLHTNNNANVEPSFTITSAFVLNRTQFTQDRITNALDIVNSASRGLYDLSLPTAADITSSSADNDYIEKRLASSNRTNDYDLTEGSRSITGTPSNSSMFALPDQTNVSRQYSSSQFNQQLFLSNNSNIRQQSQHLQQLFGSQIQHQQTEPDQQTRRNSPPSPSQISELATKLDDESTELLLNMFRK